MLNNNDQQRLWISIPVYDSDKCWPWQGSVGPNGYGRFRIGKLWRVASRLALECSLGRDLTADEKACHRCDNPLCCNPLHLFVGSDADNRADCVAKGRQHRWRGARRGQNNPRAKLSSTQVEAIRSMKGIRLQRDLAKEYGVSRQTISAVQNGDRWAVVDLGPSGECRLSQVEVK